MDWKKEAINELKAYNARKNALHNTKEKIKILEEQAVSLKGIGNDTPVLGGSPKTEDRLINNIVEREQLKGNLLIIERLLKLTEQGLAALDDKERTVLSLFYISRTSNYIDELYYKLGIERSQIYRIKDIALKRFTLAMYGVIEI